MVRWRLAMLLLVLVAVALLTAEGWRADALSLTVTETECIDEFVPNEGDSVSGYFLVVEHDICWTSDHPGIDLAVTSPDGKTVYKLKGKSGEKFEFKAPRGGTYKFCFHNPYGAPETLSVYIHVGSITDEHNVAKDGRILDFEEALEEVKMKKRFQEWMVKYDRSYKDEEEKAWRYELFKDCAKTVDKLNAEPGGPDKATYQTFRFCDLRASTSDSLSDHPSQISGFRAKKSLQPSPNRSPHPAGSPIATPPPPTSGGKKGSPDLANRPEEEAIPRSPGKIPRRE